MLVLLFLYVSPFQTREARQFPTIPYRPFPLDFFDSLGRMDRRLLRSNYAYISKKSRKIVIIQPLRHQGTKIPRLFLNTLFDELVKSRHSGENRSPGPS